MKNIFFIIIAFNFSVNGIENRYTFKGEFSYIDVLTSLASPSGRSIIGDNNYLNSKRIFHIDNKPFSIAIEQIKTLSKIDGFSLFFDSSSIIIESFFNDSSKSNEKKTYKVFLPFANRYLITENYQEYLNAKQIDLEKHKSDSLLLIDSILNKQYYKCVLYINGVTTQKVFTHGVSTNENFSLSLNVPNIKTSLNMNLGISANFLKNDDRFNFSRRLVFYVPADSFIILNLGNEIRRSNGKIESEKILTETFESIYDGLSIKVSSKFYFLKYRVSTTEVSLTGVPGDTVSGFSSFDSELLTKTGYFFRRRGSNGGTLWITSYLEVHRNTKE